MRGKNPRERESKTPGKREQDTWKDVQHPKDTRRSCEGWWSSQWDRARLSGRQRRQTTAPSGRFPVLCLGSLLWPVTQEPRRPPFPMEQQRHLVGCVVIGSDDLLNPVAFSLHFLAIQKERSVLKHLRFRKLSESQTQWKKSLAISLTISHLLLQGRNLPTARPSEDTVVGAGAVCTKGQGEGDATQMRSDLTWLCIKCPNGQETVRAAAWIPLPPTPSRRCVLFKDSVEFRPMDSSVVSGVAENSPGHVSSLLFYW